MVNTKLPLDNHVLRYAGYNRLHWNEDETIVIAFAPSAFALKDIDNGLLSVTWVEYFSNLDGSSTDNAVRAYRNSMDKALGKKSAFGKATVKAIIKAGQAHQNPTTLRVLHEPTDLNPGHAEIHRYRMDDFELMELLASEAFTEIIMNRDIPE